MTTSEGTLERLVLEAEIKALLYLEADLLDERRYTEWLDLLADDYQYAVPLRLNVMFDDTGRGDHTVPGRDICWFDEDKATASLRVDQLLTGMHWAEEPVSRVSHLVTNIRLTSTEPDAVAVSCRFLVYRNRVADETDIFVGRRKDRLRKVNGAWQIYQRELLLDQSVLSAKNLSVIL